MLDKFTYFAFPIHPFILLSFSLILLSFLHTVINVQAQIIRETNEHGYIIAT